MNEKNLFNDSDFMTVPGRESLLRIHWTFVEFPVGDKDIDYFSICELLRRYAQSLSREEQEARQILFYKYRAALNNLEKTAHWLDEQEAAGIECFHNTPSSWDVVTMEDWTDHVPDMIKRVVDVSIGYRKAWENRPQFFIRQGIEQETQRMLYTIDEWNKQTNLMTSIFQFLSDVPAKYGQ